MDLHHRTRRGRALTRLTAAAIAVASVLALQSSAAADLVDTLAEDSRLPGQGLPGFAQDPEAIGGTWIDPQATSLNYATAAKQWIKPPVFQTVANNLKTIDLSDPRCTGRLGEGIQQSREWRAPVVFVNTDVSADSAARFGRTQEFTVRTVAFGSVPVEADIALEQPRNPQNAVLPAILNQRSSTFCPGEGPYSTGSGFNFLLSQTVLEGPVSVRITGLRVDGVDVGPLPTCAATEAQLSLSAPDFYNWDPEPSPEERPDTGNVLTARYFNFAKGGLLTGTLDVPGFDGCTTPGGDDLSPLLTAAVSGDGNPVILRTPGLPPSDEHSLNDFDTVPPAQCPWNGNCDARLPQLDIPEGTPGG